MENGDGLLGYGKQACITFPQPGSKRYYYLFTVDNYNINGNGLRYSIIDMDANGGVGKVILKNHNAVGGGDAMVVLTATFHRNNRDVWVITRKQDSTKYTYASYLVTPSGISDPVFKVMIKPGGGSYMNFDQDQMRVSPDGKKLIDPRSGGGNFFHFDNETGVLTWICKIQNYAWGLGFQAEATEFSPSSKYLYLAGPGNTATTVGHDYVSQFDASANDSLSFLSSQKKVAITPAGFQNLGLFWMMQIGPDGKIYGTRFEMPKLFTINRPDEKDTACQFQLDGFDLQENCWSTLPQFLTSYVQRFYYVGSCLGTPYKFTSNFFPEPDSIQWDFGDGDSSTQLNPSHTYSSSGLFTVKVKVRYPDGRYGEAQREITVAGLPHPNLGPDQTICKGTYVHLSPGTFASYTWNTGDVTEGLYTPDTGCYWVQVVNDTGCINRDTVNISWFKQPTIDETNLNIAPTTCNAATGAITGIAIDGLQPVSYTWKNGGGTILGHDLDLFHLPVDNYTLWVSDSAGCETPVKIFTIKNVGDSLILSVDHQDTHCSQPDGIIQVNATAGLTNMLFYALDTNNFLSNLGLFTGLSPGSYQVWVKDSLGCKKVYDGNPVILLKNPGPAVLSTLVQDEINGQSDGTITITTTNLLDTTWYSIGGAFQLNNGSFIGLSSGTYTCTVRDAYGCDTTFTINLKNIPSIRLQAIAGDGSACLGNVAVLPLLANNFSHVSSFESRLKYNKSLVTCQNYLNANPALADSLQVDLFPTWGELSITWTGINPVNLPDNATLLELSFASLNTGQDSLKWDISPGICTFLDSLGNSIAPEYKQGQVRVYSIPQGSIQAPGSVCEGSDLSLLGIYAPGSGNGQITYQWNGPGNFGTQNPLAYIPVVSQSNSGEYTLVLSDTNHCLGVYSIQVEIIPAPTADFKADTIFFDEQTLLPARPGYSHYLWNTGDSSSFIQVTSEGWYKVTMKTEEGCMATDSAMMMYSFVPLTMPNAFTPNNDGMNDLFRPVTMQEKVRSFSMYIYDRWGKQIFATNDLGTGWNGTDGSMPVATGVYIYVVSYGNPSGETRKKTGVVTLVR
jgi:gliding motility-associated-like protein